MQSESTVSLQQHNAISLSVPCTSQLFSARGLFEHIEVIETAEFGRMLLLDGSPRLSDRYQSEYAELMCAPLRQQMLNSTLLLGCGTLKLGRAFAELESIAVSIWEHDPDVFSLLREFFPKQFQAQFSGKTELSCESISSSGTEKKFDAAIVDITLTADAFGVASRRDFFDSLLARVATCLAEGAVLSMNCGAQEDCETQSLFRELLANYFQDLEFTAVRLPYVLGSTVVASGVLRQGGEER